MIGMGIHGMDIFIYLTLSINNCNYYIGYSIQISSYIMVHGMWACHDNMAYVRWGD